MTSSDRPEIWIYDEKKFAKQFMLTNTASKMIDDMADELRISRSEVLERAIRSGGLDAARESFEDDSLEGDT